MIYFLVNIMSNLPPPKKKREKEKEKKKENVKTVFLASIFPIIPTVRGG